MGAGSPSVGRVWAEQGRLGLSGVGEGLGMHWDSIGYKDRSSGAAWAGSGRVGPSRAE